MKIANDKCSMKLSIIRFSFLFIVILLALNFVLAPIVKVIIHPEEISLTESEYLEISNKDIDSPVSNNLDDKKYITLKLFGFIPIKKVAVNILPFETVLVGGTPIGICGDIDGVLVTQDYNNKNIKRGDVVTKIDNNKVSDINDFFNLTKNKEQAEITFLRKDKEITKKIPKPASISIRDTTEGVGIITLVNPENNNFSALGHQMGDFNTGASVNLRGGEIKSVNTFGIEKTKKGKTGVIKSSIQNNTQVQGDITKGTKFGVTGCLTANSEILQSMTTTMPIASRYNVKPGKAILRTSLDGVTIEEFDCQILKTRFQENKADKSMIIRITDKRLLNRTGGIIHGMSGSPIIQDGHLVGALTHAMSHDPNKGYAIYIDFVAI